MELLREHGWELGTFESLLVGYSMSTPCYNQNTLKSRAVVNGPAILLIHS